MLIPVTEATHWLSSRVERASSWIHFPSRGYCLEKGQARSSDLCRAGQAQCVEPENNALSTACHSLLSLPPGQQIMASEWEPRPVADISRAHLSSTFRILTISSLSSWLPPRPVWK